MKEKNNNNKTGATVPAGKQKLSRKNIMGKYLIGIIALVGTFLLVSRSGFQPPPVLTIGEIAVREIGAQVDFSYLDTKATGLRQEEAAGNVPAIYYLSPQIKEEINRKIEVLFAALADKQQEGVVKEKVPWLSDYIDIEELQDVSDIEEEKHIMLKVSNELLDKGIIKNLTRIKLISRGQDEIFLRDPKAGRITEVNIDRFIVFDELSSVLDSRLRSIHPFDRALRQALKEVLQQIIIPNVVYDNEEVTRQKEQASNGVKPVYVTVKRGQTIIRHGDPVGEMHAVMLGAQAKKLAAMLPGYSRLWNMIGIALMIGIFFFIFVTYLHYHQPGIFSCNKRLILLTIIILLNLALARIMADMAVSFSRPFWQFFIVIPISAMLIAVLIDKELAIMSSIIMSVLAAVVAGRTLPYMVVNLFGSIVAIQSTTGVLHRWEFYRSGLLIGLANVLAIVMVNLLKITSPELILWKTVIYQALGGIASGLGCAIMVSICLPIMERLFDISTDIRLLELSDLNHPLLKKMITEAPGTYHHSIVVSNMAEDAAFAIGANPLLAKVGGYFHDIGKITKPVYFAENAWYEEKSKHEKLLPTMSNLVITAHVKDGAALARKYKLPRSVADIIREHHGTSLVYYFYKQAEISSARKGAVISEEDFRYPGPKPKTKEAGIILLADAIEAASKTLVKPTPAKIKELVKGIMSEKVNDGQLDECGITLNDLKIVRERLTHILTGILHKRVEYPANDENKNKR